MFRGFVLFVRFCICVLICLTFFVVNITAYAQTAKRPTHWDILPESSYITFQGKQSGQDFEGRFSHFNGRISFDPNLLDQSYVDIMIDLMSVEAGHRDRNKYIHYPDWLDTQKFPQARFVSSSFSESEPNRFVANGHLTLRDVTLPINLPFSLQFEDAEEGRRVVQMQGHTTLKRLDYGIGQGAWKDTKTVADTIKIKVFLKALAQK